MTADSTNAPLKPREIVKELWDHFPVVYLYITALGLLHFIVANVPSEMFAKNGVSQLGVSLTTAIPMSVVAFYYILRARNSKRIKSVPLAVVGIVFLTYVLPALIYLFYQSAPSFKKDLDPQMIIQWFEVTQIFWFAVIFLHIFKKHGWNGTVLFWGVALFYGILLENGGIIMEYFYESNFKIYLFRLPAPVCTMFGWVMVMYICSSIADRIAGQLQNVRWTPMKMALMTTGVALSLDLQLDPMASLSGIWWKWNDALAGVWFGVPMINYVAWFSAVLPFSYGLYWVRSKKDWSPMWQNRQLFHRVLAITLAAAVLNFGLMAGWELVTGDGFFSGPTYQILDSFISKVLPYG